MILLLINISLKIICSLNNYSSGLMNRNQVLDSDSSEKHDLPSLIPDLLNVRSNAPSHDINSHFVHRERAISDNEISLIFVLFRDSCRQRGWNVVAGDVCNFVSRGCGHIPRGIRRRSGRFCLTNRCIFSRRKNVSEMTQA